MTKTQENKIKKFIKENKLDFSGTDSDLNSVCCIISGYALYINAECKTDDLYKAIGVTHPNLYDELDRVLNFAYDNDYGAWWNYSFAKKQYKF
jgi:hypothetical protein